MRPGSGRRSDASRPRPALFYSRAFDGGRRPSAERFLKREAEHDGTLHISRMIATSQRCRTRHAQAQARLSGVILDVSSLDGAREADLVVVEAVASLGSWPQSSGPPVALFLRAERGLWLLSHKFDHSPTADRSFAVINSVQAGNERHQLTFV
jgi:hypothetical protein